MDGEAEFFNSFELGTALVIMDENSKVGERTAICWLMALSSTTSTSTFSRSAIDNSGSTFGGVAIENARDRFLDGFAESIDEDSGGVPPT
jgi:hypothetical protein